MLVGGALYGFHLSDKKQFFTVGRERKAFNVSVILGKLLTGCAVRIHFPYLTAAGFITEKSNLRSIFNPGGLAFLPIVTGYLSIVAS